MLKAANNSVIKLNHVVHHAALGHHVQNWYANNKAQSRIGQIAAVDVASRLAFFCAGTLAEGWATYSVSLMDESNFLTALESYSLHHARLRACARAIVDVGIHTGKLTLDQAQDFYADRVAMSESASRAEAVKNTMFPGAAMMYLIGSDAIVNLRDRNEIQARRRLQPQKLPRRPPLLRLHPRPPNRPRHAQQSHPLTLSCPKIEPPNRLSRRGGFQTRPPPRHSRAGGNPSPLLPSPPP